MVARTIPPSHEGERHPNWSAIEQSAAFRELVSARLRFIIPATAFFIVYYFALPVLDGYFPGLMETKVIGAINLAYLFALSQFAMTWIIMGLYISRARQFDAQEKRIVDDVLAGTLR